MSNVLETGKTNGDAFERLVEIVEELRMKCPWDKKQTFETLRHLTIEETYELADAIIEDNPDAIREELGDVLMHMVFYATLGKERGSFNIKEAINQICEKLITRHPHIYSDVIAETPEEVKQNWEQIKLKEGKKSVFDGVPSALPAIIKSVRIQEKASQLGFDWENMDQVWEKVEEEISELKFEVRNGDIKKTEEEFGDLLFAMINYARFLKIDPESALERSNKKFIKRFKNMESLSSDMDKELHNMSLEELEALWQKSKSL